tara:strand:+ start:6594 stop:7184 length:591 start_codon:yes stop_codon:yes gene_type:complete
MSINWPGLCTKYKLAQNENNNEEMVELLQQIIAYWANWENVDISVIQAFAIMRERCPEHIGDFVFRLPDGLDHSGGDGSGGSGGPGGPTTDVGELTDCYDCRRNVMTRVPEGVKCPDGWLTSPVVNGLSEDPCKGRRIIFDKEPYIGKATKRYSNMNGTDSGFNMQHKVFGLTMLLGGLYIGVMYHSQIKKLIKIK